MKHARAVPTLRACFAKNCMADSTTPHPAGALAPVLPSSHTLKLPLSFVQAATRLVLDQVEDPQHSGPWDYSTGLVFVTAHSDTTEMRFDLRFSESGACRRFQTTDGPLVKPRACAIHLNGVARLRGVPINEDETRLTIIPFTDRPQTQIQWEGQELWYVSPAKFDDQWFNWRANVFEHVVNLILAPLKNAERVLDPFFTPKKNQIKFDKFPFDEFESLLRAKITNIRPEGSARLTFTRPSLIGLATAHATVSKRDTTSSLSVAASLNQRSTIDPDTQELFCEAERRAMLEWIYNAIKDEYPEQAQEMVDEDKKVNESTAGAKPTFPAETADQKKRRGGPDPTPEEKIMEIIKGWLAVRGKEPKHSYCSRVATAESTLSKWMRDRNIR